jgi:hypothetical protein
VVQSLPQPAFIIFSSWLHNPQVEPHYLVNIFRRRKVVHIQIVNFNLNGMSDSEFRAMSDHLAPTFASVPGLISKTWLVDEASNTYGGVYLWNDEASCQAYKQSGLFNTVKTHPNFANVSSREFGVLDGPSTVTRATSPAMANA